MRPNLMDIINHSYAVVLIWCYGSHENISSQNQIRILLEKEFQPIAGNKSVRADALLILLQDYAFIK